MTDISCERLCLFADAAAEALVEEEAALEVVEVVEDLIEDVAAASTGVEEGNVLNNDDCPCRSTSEAHKRSNRLLR